MMKAVVIALVLFVGVASALDCFECNSHEDSACGDEFNSDSESVSRAFKKSCPVKAGFTPFCRKVKMWLEDEVGDGYRVHRDCGYGRREGYECYQQRAEDHIVDTCQCDGDLCNTGASITPMVGLLTATAAVLLVR